MVWARGKSMAFNAPRGRRMAQNVSASVVSKTKGRNPLEGNCRVLRYLRASHGETTTRQSKKEMGG